MVGFIFWNCGLTNSQLFGIEFMCFCGQGFPNQFWNNLFHKGGVSLRRPKVSLVFKSLIVKSLSSFVAENSSTICISKFVVSHTWVYVFWWQMIFKSISKQYASKGGVHHDEEAKTFGKSVPCVQIPHRQIFVIVCSRKFQHNMYFSTVAHVSEAGDSVSAKEKPDSCRVTWTQTGKCILIEYTNPHNQSKQHWPKLASNFML